jgi:hypothetical protein
MTQRRMTMHQRYGTKTLLASVCATWLLTIGGLVGIAQADRAKPALAADHVIACIRTASAAQAGLVREVDVKYKRGQWLCEVDMVDDSGQKHELSVDVTTNQIIKTERD